MKQNHTDITIVLDRSGSMESVKEDTIGGFNQFLSDQKKATGTAALTLNQFDDVFENVIKGQDIQSVDPLTNNTYKPRNMTALLDAVGRSINEAGARLDALPEGEKPANVVFVILTDGLENASTEFTQGKVKTMVEHQRDRYNWQFVFIGANMDAFDVGRSMGTRSANTITMAHNRSGIIGAFCSASTKLASYRSTGNTQSLEFDDEDYKKQKDAGAKY